MKKFISIIVILVMSVIVMNAEKSVENTDSHVIVYYQGNDRTYHKSYHDAKLHHICFDGSEDTDKKVYLQLKNGCKKAHMVKCPLCFGFENNN